MKVPNMQYRNGPGLSFSCYQHVCSRSRNAHQSIIKNDGKALQVCGWPINCRRIWIDKNYECSCMHLGVLKYIYAAPWTGLNHLEGNEYLKPNQISFKWHRWGGIHLYCKMVPDVDARVQLDPPGKHDRYSSTSGLAKEILRGVFRMITGKEKTIFSTTIIKWFIWATMIFCHSFLIQKGCYCR